MGKLVSGNSIMTKHIPEEQLIAYIMQTLTDAAREQIDVELQQCAACRQLLQDLVVEYRTVERGLAAQLGKVRPSSQATFATLAPRLRPPSRWRGFQMQKLAFPSVVALALIAIAVFVFANSQRSVYEPAPGDVITVSQGRSPINNAGFEAGSDGVPTGWVLSGPPPRIYEARRDGSVAAEGQASALLTAVDADLSQFGILEQSIAADDFLGERVRLSALVKSDGVSDWAGLFMLAKGPGQQAAQFDHMYNRPIVGTTDWSRYEVVLDVPEDSQGIKLGLLLAGSGSVWLDDVVLQVVEDDIATTDLLGQGDFYDLDNPDFEAPLSVRGGAPLRWLVNDPEAVGYTRGWFLAGSRPADYEIRQDAAQVVRGQTSALLASTAEEAPGFGTLMQSFRADEYLGQRLRYTAWVKSEDVEDWAGLWLRVDGITARGVTFDNMSDRPIVGTTNWTQYEVVLDVPEYSQDINLGILMQGTGRVWIDDVQLAAVDLSVATTDVLGLMNELQNPDFEAEFKATRPDNWYISGQNPENYEAKRDTTEAISGDASALITSRDARISDSTTLMQTIGPDEYLGQRVRLTGWVKTEDVSNFAGLWLRIYGPNNTQLKFDNMADRQIRGTTGWTQYEVVLDVPEDSTRLNLGIVFSGNGRVWLDDVQLEIVGTDVPTTD